MKSMTVLCIVAVIEGLVFHVTPLSAQLADSPWPTYQHDYRRSGCSPYNGPEQAEIDWEYESDERWSNVGNPIIGADGTIYFLEEALSEVDIYEMETKYWKVNALSYDGEHKWSIKVSDEIRGNLSIDINNVIYFHTWDSLYAVNENGTIKWTIGKYLQCDPLISRDGSILSADYGGIVVFDQNDGSEKDRLFTDNNSYITKTILDDDILYAVTLDTMLYAINVTQDRVLWQHKLDIDLCFSYLSSGDNNSVFVASYNDDKLMAVNQNGVQWTFSPAVHDKHAYICRNPVAIGPNKQLFLPVGESLMVLDPAGYLQYILKHSMGNYGVGTNVEPLVDAVGSVYFYSIWGDLCSFSPRGQEKWNINLGENFTATSLAMGFDGTICCGLNHNGWTDDYWGRSKFVAVSGPSIQPDKPSLAAIPRELDFSTVFSGDYISKTLQIKNIGHAELQISDMQITGANAVDFSIQAGGGAVTIAPNQSHELALRFTPGTGGTETAVLQINSNAPSSPDEIPLAGITAYPLAHSPWPQFQRDPQHSGRIGLYGPGEPNVVWTYRTDDAVEAQPVIGPEGEIYVGSFDGSMYALDSDGRLRWTFPTEGEILGAAAVLQDGTVLFGSCDYHIYALDKDGQEKWSFATDGTIGSSPAVGDNGLIYIASQDHYLYALAQDGSLVWKKKLDGASVSSPACAADGTVYITTLTGTIYAFSPDGRLLHQYETHSPIYSSPAVTQNGTIYIGTQWDGLFSLDASLSKQWQFDTRSPIYGTPVVAQDGTVYTGTFKHVIFAVTTDGQEKWNYAAGAPIQSSPVIDGKGTIFFGANDGIYAVNTKTFEHWRKAIPGGVKSSPAIGLENRLFVGANDGNIYSFQYETRQWNDTLVFTEDFEIPTGQVLTIEPGTRVRFRSKGGNPFMQTTLHVDGTIKAIGTRDQPIVFESIDSDTGRSKWYGIQLSEKSENNEFRHCQFRNAFIAIDGNGNWASREPDYITDCDFQYCGTAIGLTGRCPTTIERNSICDCNTGINVNTSRAGISDNWIAGVSGDAISCAYSTLEIHRNCILDYDRHGINLASADAQIINNVIFTRHGLNGGHAVYEHTNPEVPRWGVPRVRIVNNVLMSIYNAPVYCETNSLGQLYVLFNLCYGFLSIPGVNLTESSQNIVDQDPGFVDMEADDKSGFLLDSGSPCIDAGEPDLKDADGSDCDIGVFGGPGITPPVIALHSGEDNLQKTVQIIQPFRHAESSSVLTWPHNDVGAYNIYRSDAPDTHFVRLNPRPVPDNHYYIGHQPPGYFMLRSARGDTESYNSRAVYQQPDTDPVWTDQFNDSCLDKQYWTRSGDSSSIVQEGDDGLQLQLVDSRSADLNGLFNFSGDFDIQLEYSMLLPDSSGSGLQMILETKDFYAAIGRVYYLDRMTQDGKTGHMYSCEFSQEPDGTSLSAQPSDSAGLFRIVRSGSQISFYFQQSAAWTLLESRTLTSADLGLHIRLSASQPLPNLMACLHGFTVYNGTLITISPAAVCRYVPQTYATIREALDASMPGDTIQVSAGVYTLSETLLNTSLNDLHLIGAWKPDGADTTLIDMTVPGTFDAFRFENVSGCEISGFVIQHARKGISLHQCSECEISNCFIRACDESGSWHGDAVCIGGDSRNISIHHCIFDRNEFHAIELNRTSHVSIYNNTITRTLKYDGIIFGGTCSYINIYNNIIAYGNEEGIEITGNPEYYNLDYNCYWHNAGGPVAGGKPGAHALHRDPLFVDLENGNFTLMLDSPCWIHGFNGDMIGAVSTFFTRVDEQNILPLTFQMRANYPNPFNACTRIDFQLPKQLPVKLFVVNILGQYVCTLLDETRPAGEHSVLWRGIRETDQPVASGVYFCVIQTPEWKDVQKMLLLR